MEPDLISRALFVYLCMYEDSEYEPIYWKYIEEDKVYILESFDWQSMSTTERVE